MDKDVRAFAKESGRGRNGYRRLCNDERELATTSMRVVRRGVMGGRDQGAGVDQVVDER